LGGLLTVMTWELYAAYLAATVIVLTIPGPTVMLVVSYALTEGRRSALGTVAGVAAGDLTAMTLSLAGMGALLSASADLFTALKWIGAAYLIYLGVKLWRAPPAGDSTTPETERRSGLAMMGHAFAVTALNPKSIAFFVAFVPQFLDHGAPLLPQFAILEATFVTLALLNALAYALAADRLRSVIRRPRTLKWMNRAGAGCLVGMGAATAAAGRA